MRRAFLAAILLLPPLLAFAQDTFAQGTFAQGTADTGATRSGREIYARFRDGLADKECGDSSERWRRHYAAAPKRLAYGKDDVLPLFGYVVDALREASLPTEYALIPFVESGYKPGARSPSGPAGMWQFIALTARKHNVPIRAGYDGRLSPVDSTRAAVRYLKTLHGMFAGDWRLAVMAYNAGEYRIFGALRRSGQEARNAKPDTLPGLSGITHAYVRKLHALSCLLEQSEARGDWLQALDRQVPVLSAEVLPPDARDLGRWARNEGYDAAMVRRLNPAFAHGRVARADGRAQRVLVPRLASADLAAESQDSGLDAMHALAAAAPDTVPVTLAEASDGDAAGAIVTTTPAPEDAPAVPRRSHTVSRGESAWRIARRYGVSVGELLARNGLDARGLLRPGMVLRIDADPAVE